MRRIFSRYTLVWLVLAVALLGLAAACDDEEEGDGTPPAATPTEPSQPQDTPTSAATPTPEPAGRVVIGTQFDPEHLDGAIAVAPSRAALGNYLEPLVFLDAELDVHPWLAESWEQMDATTWRFNLRQGVMFHNGEELTAEDVVASVEHVLGAAEVASLVGKVDGATVVDDYTVDITTSEAQPATPSRVFFLLIEPASVLESDPDSLRSNPVGTGPYQVSDFSPGSSLVLTRFDDYWGDPPHFDEVEFRFILEDSVRLQAIQAGEIDLSILPSELAAQAPQLISHSLPKILGVRINAFRPPLDNPDVRLALNLAVDKQAILDSIFEGLGTLRGQMEPPSSTGFVEELEPYDYDPDRARQLLEDAGATGTTLELMCWNESPNKNREFCQALQPMLEDVGLNVDLQLVQLDPYVKQATWRSEEIPIENVVHLWTVAHDNLTKDGFRTWDTWMTCESSVGTFCDEDVDALVDQARGISDPDELADAHEEVGRKLYDVVPFIVALQLDQQYGAASDIVWDGRSDQRFPVFEMSSQ